MTALVLVGAFRTISALVWNCVNGAGSFSKELVIVLAALDNRRYPLQNGAGRRFWDYSGAGICFE
ncbi:MAG: hypothetical protein ACK5CA_09305 [Cyanobacteriota bacterium]|jgi:hypothetical protein